MKTKHCLSREAGALFTCLLLLSACESPDWGDRALEFARNDIRPLSEKYSEASLSSRWALAMEAALLESHAKLSEITHEATLLSQEQSRAVNSLDLTRTDAPDPDADVRYLLDHGHRMARLGYLHNRAQAVGRGLGELEALCSNRRVFDESGLARDGRMALPALDQKDVQFAVAGPGVALTSAGALTVPVIGWVFAGITTIGSAIEATLTFDQNDKLKAAARVASRNLLQGDQLFESSRRLCATHWEAVQPAVGEYQRTLAALLDQIKVLTALFEKQAEAVSVRIGRRLLAARLATSELGQSVRDFALRLRVEEQLGRKRKWNLRFRDLFAVAVDAAELVRPQGDQPEWLASCVRARIATEELQELIRNSDISLDGFSPREQREQSDLLVELNRMLQAGGCLK
jgi:hypothetical protein